jgi:hypothetical protein
MMKRRRPDFKQLYKEAAKLAASIPWFPSKDKILVGDHLPPVRMDDWIYDYLLFPRGHRRTER